MLVSPACVYRGDDLALDSFIPVSGDATCSNIVIAGSAVLRATGSCVRENPGPIAEPTTGWTPTPEPRGVMAGYHGHAPAPAGPPGARRQEPGRRSGAGRLRMATSWPTRLLM